jgi:hypothetical protein
MIAWFDITQLYILQFKTFSIPNNHVGPFDLEKLFLTGWYTEVDGFFYNDVNENGKRDSGEEGISGGPFPLLQLRDGTQIDRGFQFEVPFSDPERKGFYSFRQTYPLASWLTLHAFHPLWEITGYTYKTEQQQTSTDVKAEKAGEYNIALFGTPGVNTRLDVGFVLKTKKDGQKRGSILGSVNYDTTRTNQDAHQAVVENHEPGLPFVKVSLHKLDPFNNNGFCGGCNEPCSKDINAGFGYDCPDEGNVCDSSGQSLICTRFWVGDEGESKPHPVTMWTLTDTGQLFLGFSQNPKEERETAQFEPPTNCKITGSTGTVLSYGAGQSVLPEGEDVPCIETPLLRNQVGGFSKVDGMFQFDDVAEGYYAIQVEIPMDKHGTKPAYKVRTENDINAYESDDFENVDPMCVAVAGQEECPVCPSVNPNCPMPVDAEKPLTPNLQNVRMPCAGAFFTVASNGALEEGINPTFAKNGGSYAAGELVHYCDIKIVHVEQGVNSRATFHLFTDVPIPSRWKGVVLNDLIPQGNPKATLFTELMGIPGMPVGIRDYMGDWLTDVQTDVSTLVFLVALQHFCAAHFTNKTPYSISFYSGERLF